jgi:hypothetical protein
VPRLCRNHTPPTAFVWQRTNGKRAVVTRADEYRLRAQECLAAARTATKEARATLINMARVWLRVAEELEGPPPPRTADEPQPVIQQQQQPQPKKDGDAE